MAIDRPVAVVNNASEIPPASCCGSPVPSKAITVNDYAVVDEERCVGCGVCVLACPFGTVHIDAETGRAVKCDLCHGEPACAVACPTQAIELVEVRDPQEATGWVEELAEAVRSRHMAAFGTSTAEG